MTSPNVFTLCDYCNKEFKIEFNEDAHQYIIIWTHCPHCGKSNHRWLRIPKEKEPPR